MSEGRWSWSSASGGSITVFPLKDVAVGRGIDAIEARGNRISSSTTGSWCASTDHTMFLQHDIEKPYGLETPRFLEALIWSSGVAFLPSIQPRQAVGVVSCSLFRRCFSEHCILSMESLSRILPPGPATLEYKGKHYCGMSTREGKEWVRSGGTVPFSFWPNEPSLMQMIRDAGYSNISHTFERIFRYGLAHITIIAKA